MPPKKQISFMKFLIVYYSRSGNTALLVNRLRENLQGAGHSVALEKISVGAKQNKWQLILPLWTALCVIPFYLQFAPVCRWWLKHYPQAEMPIQPLAYPDVSDFDCICIGTPKWLYLSYPVARYLHTVTGPAGKRVDGFATFCGPPLPNFELEMLFAPLAHRIRERGGEMVAQLAISSHFHEFFFFHEMEYVFRGLSHLFFRRPLREFTMESGWGHKRN